MTRLLSRTLPVALLLIAAGLGLWWFGRLQERSAETYKQLLTMAYEEPRGEWAALERDLRYLRQLPFVSGIDRTVREQQTTSQYWTGQHQELQAATAAGSGSGMEAPDDVLMFHAANAAYRRTAVDERTPGAIEIMEGILARYADLLRRGTWRLDWAYNYEFVARRRDALLRAARSRRADSKSADDASSGPPRTIHGMRGAVPPGVDMSEFKIVVPQRSDERRQQPEAGKGGPKPRRG
jgi:hypothetical protein